MQQLRRYMGGAGARKLAAVETQSAPRAQTNIEPSARVDAIFVLNSLNVAGTERKLVRLANHFRERGMRAAIAYLNGPEDLLDAIHPEVMRCHLGRTARVDVAAAKRLAAMIDALQPSVVFAANLYPTLYVYAAARLLGRSRPGIVALINTTDMGGERWRNAIYKPVLSRFDWIVYGCQYQREHWSAQRASVNARTSVIYNGVDLEEFNEGAVGSIQSLRLKFGLGQRAFVIGSIGRMNEPKNHRALIDAVADLRARGIDARLVLAGDGPRRAALEAQAKQLNVEEAVIMTGNVSDVRPLLALMDVFVLPSLYIETFSNAALEAMAMGKPVVLSDVGGATEMIRDRVDGYVIARQQLTTELPRLLHELASDRDQLDKYGRAALRRVESTFSIDVMVEQYASLIRRVGALREAAPAHVVQVGPGLGVRGGVASVERLIVDHVGSTLRVQHVPSMEDGSIAHKIFVFLRSLRAFRRAIAGSEPQVVHIHFSSYGSTLRKSLLIWMAVRAGRPVVLHAHGSVFDQFYDKLPRFLQRVVTKTFSQAERFIVLSSQWKEFYVRRCGIPEQRVVVMTNPAALPASVPDRRGRSVIQFVSLGRIGQRKGSFDLLKAFAALPDEVRARARLVIAGDGEVEALRAAAEPLRSQVEVHGWIDADKRDELLAASDVFVLPSYNEGVPMALLEAMASGLPVIATPVGGIPDAMTHGVEGELVEPGAIGDLTASLLRLITDEDRRLRLGRAARARAERHDVVHYADELVALYRELAPVGIERQL